MKGNGFTYPRNSVWRLVDGFVSFEVVLLKLAACLLALMVAYLILDALMKFLKQTSKRDGGALPEVQSKTLPFTEIENSLAKNEGEKCQEISAQEPKISEEAANKESEKNQERKTYLPKPVELTPEELKQKAIRELLGR